jgi:hypothetical protein
MRNFKQKHYVKVGGKNVSEQIIYVSKYCIQSLKYVYYFGTHVPGRLKWAVYNTVQRGNVM